MATDPLLVGIDFGSTNLKVIIFDPAGQVVALASAPTPTTRPQPGQAEHDPWLIWNVTAGLLRQVTAQVDASRIVSIAITSVGEAAVSLDAQGNPTHPSIAWYDNRTEPESRWLSEHVGRDALFASSGLSIQPIYSLCKLLWLHRHAPEALQRTRYWLYMADYLAYRLSGQAATDYSLASRTLMLDIQGLRWNYPLIERIGLPTEVLAPLRPSGTLLGTITPEAAAQTGLPLTTKVAVGGHDHVCGALGLGVVEPDTMLDSMGTAEAFFLPQNAPCTDIKSAEQGYSQGGHVAGGYYMLGGLYTSGACVDWFRQAFAGGADHATLIAEAESVPAGSLGVVFQPYLRLASSPHDDPKARGVFLGLNTDATRGVLFRAVLEGLALEMRSSATPVWHYARVPQPQRVVATGGGSRNRLLVRIKAAVLNKPIDIVSIEQATALGAAMLGGVAAGVYANVSAAPREIRYDHVVIEPEAGLVETYARLYENVYQHVYPAVRELHHAIYAEQHPSAHAQ